MPFQQVYHASVEAEREPYLECYEVSGLVKVGEFHSHGRIPAFFSATDDEDETFPGLYGVVSCGDDRKVYRAVLGADKQIFLTEEQMKTVVYDSDEDRLSWVLGWFHQSTTRASEMEATILCWWGRKDKGHLCSIV